MLSYYRYWQALKRLESSTKTIELMQPDVPDMVQAQHEMIQLEAQYYRDTSRFFTIGLLTFIVASVIIYLLYINGVFNV